MVAGYILQDGVTLKSVKVIKRLYYYFLQETVASWRLVYLFAASVYVFMASFYLIFASAEVQPWDSSSEKEEKGSAKVVEIQGLLEEKV